VLGLVLDEERAARFVYSYTSEYARQGIAGEAERKAELLAAIERESLLLVAARIEQTLPQVVRARFSPQAESEAVARFQEAFLTFWGGSLAWASDERASFRRDLAVYLRVAARQIPSLGSRPGKTPAAGPFVDRCAFLIDPSMMTQARESAGRYQVELESCADQAVRAAFRGLRRPKTTPSGSPAHRHPTRPKSRSGPEKRPRR
jgi:hypothetical protein